MERPRFWYWRVAFSAITALACVLLIGLWVRSYYYAEGIVIPGIPIRLTHFKGELALHGWLGSPFQHRSLTGIPYLVVVLAAGLLPALPWLKWSRRFSVRSMLIISTVVALALATLSMSLKVR